MRVNRRIDSVQSLFEDWYDSKTSLYWERSEVADSYLALLKQAREVAVNLGLEWRHQGELEEQEHLELPEAPMPALTYACACGCPSRHTRGGPMKIGITLVDLSGLPHETP